MSADSTALLEPPQATAPEKQRRHRAADAGKVIKMIQGRYNSAEFQKRLKLSRMIEDAFDRVPPDSEADLAADGLGWCANVDWGGMCAGITDGVEIDYNLATQPETYVRLISSQPKRDGVVDAMAVLERLDKEMLDDWSEWLPELEMMLHNRRALGLGIFHFPHPHGWHFKSLHPCNLVLPPKSKLNSETWSWCALKTEFQITDLLKRLADESVSTELGWKPAAIKTAIEHFAQEGGREWIARIAADPEAFILDLEENDLWFSHENGTAIEGWVFYVREWSGRVSEHLLVNKDEIGFIYSGLDRHESMADVLALFPLSLGQGYVERIRGYGMQMLPFHDLENQVMNHSVDVTMLASGLVLQSGQGDDWKRLREEVHVNGPITSLPDGFTIGQQSFANPTGGLLALRREFERLGNFRNRAFGGAEYGQRSPEESATGARLRWQEANSVKTFEIARYYRQLSNFHRVRWLKLMDGDLGESDPGGKAALALVQESLAEGVTAEDIASVKRVLARSIFGDGDPVNQFLALMDLKEFYPQLPPSGQKLFRRLVFGARMRDVHLVSELIGADDGRDAELSWQRWCAQQENAVFEVADTRLDLKDDDNHLVHAGEHTVYAEEVKLRLDKGEVSEEDAFSRILRAQTHVQPHLAALAVDPFAQVPAKDLSRRWADLINTARQLGQHLEAKRQKAQAEQLEELRNPKPSVKEQEAALTEQVKRESAVRLAALEAQMLREKHAVEMELMRQKAVTSELEKRAKTLPEIGASNG